MKSIMPVLAAVIAILLLAGCKPKPSDAFHGYVEGEYVHVSAPLSGTLRNLSVKRGDEIQKDAALFELEQESELAAVKEVEKRLVQAQARRENLGKGKRLSEIAALEARLAQAKVSLGLAETELARRERVQKSGSGAISLEQLEQARAQRDGNKAQVDTFAAELETARLGGREDEIKAAEAEVDAFAAAVEKARWPVNQKSKRSPVSGVVHDTLYDAGEWVAAGHPIVSVLPTDKLKVRFFVPQAELPNLKVGQKVSVTFDGGTAPLAATINYIATQAEFTPPIIYSQENRSKLVFMIEAAFGAADARNVRPGQPVDVRRNP